MVLLILTAIWAVVLIPPWVRSRREERSVNSIVTFNRRLSSLERTTPRYEAYYSDDMYLDTSYLDELGEGVGDDDPAAAGGVVARAEMDAADVVDMDARELGPLPARPAVASAPLLSAAGQRALHRRRRIFFGLLAMVAVTLGAAAALSSVTGWAVHAGAVGLFLGYVALLVQHHQRALDHAVKVRYISPIRAPRPAVVVLRSSAGR